MATVAVAVLLQTAADAAWVQEFVELFHEFDQAVIVADAVLLQTAVDAEPVVHLFAELFHEFVQAADAAVELRAVVADAVDDQRHHAHCHFLTSFVVTELLVVQIALKTMVAILHARTQAVRLPHHAMHAVVEKSSTVVTFNLTA